MIALFLRSIPGVFLTFSITFCAAIQAANPALMPPVRQPDGRLEIPMNGSSSQPVVLQGSADMNGWTDLQTFQLNGEPVFFQPATGAAVHHQYFRLKFGAPNPPLPDLSALSNAVFPAGEGFDTMQFAPNGTLGMIFWNGRELTIRERTPAGNWSEQVVSGGGNLFQLNVTRQDYKFQPAALLLYDSNSKPHVFRLNGSRAILHFVRSGGAWAQSETIENNRASANLDRLVGALGPGDTFHLAAISGGDSPNLTCGSKRNGAWRWSVVSPVAAFPRFYLAPSYAARWFSMAVDSNNGAHIVFHPEYRLNYSGGYPRAYNELAYASNQSGSWSVQIVQRPLDDSGEAGNGLSVAIGPDDRPCIASWYNERGDGGSSQESRLFFHSRDGSGNWTKSEVISRPDGYTAGDGEKGTGFAPYLRFDAQGRPHILFLDHGSEHFAQSGQIEYAGNIRHAVRNGSQWQIETVSRQKDPKREQMIYPAFAMNGDEMVMTGLERTTVWNMAPYPPVVTSTYRFRAVSAQVR